MTFLFHKTAFIDTILQEGLKSNNILAQEGKVEKGPDHYECAVSSYEKWLEDNPDLFFIPLTNWLENNGSARFDDPSHPGNRFNNVYFQFLIPHQLIVIGSQLMFRIAPFYTMQYAEIDRSPNCGLEVLVQ